MIGTVQSSKKDSPIFKIIESGKYNLIKDYHINDKYAGPGYLAFNAGHVKVNSIDPASLSSAMITGRKIARQFQEGLAEYEPKTFASSYLAATAALMGVRESRRIKCDYTFTLEDWLDRKELGVILIILTYTRKMRQNIRNMGKENRMVFLYVACCLSD